MEIISSQEFANEWVEAWNSHDIDKILAHYADDFEMTSPIINVIENEPKGKLIGKTAVRRYWEKALALNPDLHFDIIAVFSGVESVVIHYQGHRGLSAEVFHFGDDGKVIKSYAHYSQCEEVLLSKIRGKEGI
ncbi:MAG: nuclear transport factor 2 family protein [Ectothiorhodospiraceae bacterium]|nr:nuclear transport factor 2 family protein [Ectothiorhodospiraceae bacterium]